MTQEIELPPARASRAHRAYVLNETYVAAQLNGVPAVAGPVDGDAWAKYANGSMMTRSEYRELMAGEDLNELTEVGVLAMEPPC